MAQHLSFDCLNEFPTAAAAQQAAQEAAMATGGKMYPCVCFKQADRMMMVVAVPMKALRSRLTTQPSIKGGDPRSAQNRPVDNGHVNAIKKYLVENSENYILPPLCATYREKVGIYTVNFGASKQGFLVISEGQMASVADGQHRFIGVAGTDERDGALIEQPALEDDSVAVQITVEPSLQRIHQDFADMGMTKALPKSLLTAYDMRDPINRLVNDLATKSVLLKGRVDESSAKSLPKRSPRLVLSSWLRGLVKGAIARDYFVSDEALKNAVHDYLGTETQYDDLLSDLMFTFEVAAENIPVISKIVEIDPESAHASRIPELRERTVFLTAAGLGICGHMIQCIRKEAATPDDRRAVIKRLFTKIDWTRPKVGEINPIWTDGGIVAGGGSIRPNRANISRSTAHILQALALAVPKQFERAVNRANAAA